MPHGDSAFVCSGPLFHPFSAVVLPLFRCSGGGFSGAGGAGGAGSAGGEAVRRCRRDERNERCERCRPSGAVKLSCVVCALSVHCRALSVRCRSSGGVLVLALDGQGVGKSAEPWDQEGVSDGVPGGSFIRWNTKRPKRPLNISFIFIFLFLYLEME